MALNHARPFERAGIHASLVEGLRNRTLRPVIAHELPIRHAARSHEAVMAPGHHGKVILVPRGAADGAPYSNGAMLTASCVAAEAFQRLSRASARDVSRSGTIGPIRLGREAGRRASCGKSACGVRPCGGWKRGKVEML
jgi:hypothetical protein